MSAEYVADRLMDSLPNGFDLNDSEPCEDLRTGGFFFDIEVEGKEYEVLVVEVRRG